MRHDLSPCKAAAAVKRMNIW